jgi:hypothetical protein
MPFWPKLTSNGWLQQLDKIRHRNPEWLYLGSQNFVPALSNVGVGESRAASTGSWLTENRANSGEQLRSSKFDHFPN